MGRQLSYLLLFHPSFDPGYDQRHEHNHEEQKDPRRASDSGYPGIVAPERYSQEHERNQEGKSSIDGGAGETCSARFHLALP